ncbi:HAD superfamily hydrolase (TIGR01484 family)/P-type E1-E2 ATPase [Flavimobilis soli]|jgi:hydroxymethylpyrimidine pyrophosphatase-like HAD family hydrolase|uniref:HAD superfamily hydrolase (TIGR01484 family)/P-type E1-E2 ATPase n=1 Tax=Flavimobilis soli TaxID=442709 RepID=A0A2A9ECU8_9MICO|nr:HAD family hydrolase [Flavimobilis soli]PFG36734.1 HAD superfamily hydrolase (TIGR01484 family)/P-type E1-E2 ATPase [Flavimobilis soli]
MSGSPAGLEDVQEPLRWPDSVLPAPSGADHLVALDVDGTLMTEDGFISPEAKALVREIRAAGSHVVLATGRPLVALLPVADELGLDDGYLVASNGSVTARLGGPQGYEIDDAVMFEAGPALDLVLHHMPRTLFAVEEVGVGYWVAEPFPERTIMGRQTVVDLRDLAERATTRIVAVDAGEPVGALRAGLAELGLSDTHFSIADLMWMDVAPQDVSKASALERVRAKLGVHERATVAVGDGGNDVEMLRWASCGVAMGHAAADVVAAADTITGSILDDGVVAVLQAVLDRLEGVELPRR